MRSLSGVRALTVATAGVALACGVISVAAAAVSTPWNVVPSPHPRYSHCCSITGLQDVAAASSTDAWAVGTYVGHTAQRTLIVHWNGQAWKFVRTPTLGGSSQAGLNGVAAVSATDAWAVGSYLPNSPSEPGGRPLAEHWNGTAWKFVPAPTPSGADNTTLWSVVATSASNAWAVGYYYVKGMDTPTALIERWDGHTWKVAPAPNPGPDSSLYGVAAASSTNAWAVGQSSNGTLIERWNGQTWAVVPGGSSSNGGLRGVTVISATDAWAVGGSSSGTLIEHWNGQAWKVVPSPSPGGSLALLRVAATSSTNAWAVGSYHNSNTGQQPLTEHWNGQAWRVVPSPSLPGGYHQETFLGGVAITSRTNAWAAGTDGNQSVIERWNGKT